MVQTLQLSHHVILQKIHDDDCLTHFLWNQKRSSQRFNDTSTLRNHKILCSMAVRVEGKKHPSSISRNLSLNLLYLHLNSKFRNERSHAERPKYFRKSRQHLL
jgi:hypothetical protein